MTKIRIEIESIKNGFTIYFFADYPGPSDMDGTIFVEKWEQIITEIQTWYKKILDWQG
jgi:hypothetical protein